MFNELGVGDLAAGSEWLPNSILVSHVVVSMSWLIRAKVRSSTVHPHSTCNFFVGAAYSLVSAQPEGLR